jgi:N-formylglutamate amidohydrolase
MNRFLPLCLVWLCALSLRAADLVPGESTFGEHHFIEYVVGDLPIVLTAPHGGHLEPEEIPARTAGVREADANTQELARAVADEIHARTGHYAHLIICHLHRSKLDANRDIGEAAGGDALAEQAWREHHGFIEQARTAASARFGVAFLIDLHGHGHPGQRVELGYLHATEDYALEDAALNAPAFAAASSLGLLAAWSHRPYTELLRGPASLGALLEQEGFRATPSPSAPQPIAPYFRGGYTVARHCRAAELTTGLQIECYRAGLRDTAENRAAFARGLVAALERFFPERLALTLKGEPHHTAAAPAE